MGHVVTVTANAALDRTIYVEELRTGQRQRLQSEHAQAGGKGVNVSRVLASLGIGVRSVVLLGGATGHAIERDLEASGLDPVGVRAPGESRTCLEILETRIHRVTQLHGRGVSATGTTLQALEAAVESSLEGASWLALCGSLADGCPENTYSRLAMVARRRGVRVALDTSGSPLKHAWSASPDLLRINREEAADALGDASRALPPIETPGTARLSVVSDGPRNVWAWDSGGLTWQVTPPPVRERNPIGCGDTMLAGLLARLDYAPVEEALRFATSLATAGAASEHAGVVDQSLAKALLPKVSIIRS